MPVGRAQEAADSGGSVNVLDPAHGGKIDLFLTGPDDAFTTSRLARRIRAEVFDVPCWVASAEDVVIAGKSLKVVAAQFEVDASTLAREFRRAGVPIRVRRGWPPST